MTEFELGILDKIQKLFGSPFGDRFFPAITSLGDAGMIWIAFILILITIPHTRKMGYVAAVSLILEAVVCNLILKPMVGRIRPCDVAEGIQLLIPRPEDYSFPSGHTAASFSVASSLLFCKSKLGIPTLILAVLIAFSRLYLYVHFPSDVLIGALIGTASGFLAWYCKISTGEKRNSA